MDSPRVLPVIPFAPVRAHGLPLPGRAHESDAGFDLPLDLTPPEDGARIRVQRMPVRLEETQLWLAPGTIAWVRTGWAVGLPTGYEGQVRGRSGLALKHGVTVWHVGTIDADYRGELWVALVNDGMADVALHHGDRIAQLVVAPVCRWPARPATLEALTTTLRGSRGFGSTGQ